MTDLIVIAILIVISALFSAAEFSIVRMRRSRIEQLIEEGDIRARRVRRLLSRPERFLAVIQIAVTFVAVLAGGFAGAGIVGEVERVLGPLIGEPAGWISLLLVTLLIAMATIVFGELVPKTIAISNAERLALFFAGPIVFFGRVFAPVVWLLSGLTRAVTRLFGVTDAEQDRLTAEELMFLVEQGGQQGIIEAEEQQMIGAVLELGEQRVHEVMVPRIAIIGAPSTASLEELVEIIVREGHSRIPIYEETIDNVIGILYAKDLLPYVTKGAAPQVGAILRTPLFVPESISVDDLLHSFQRRKVHIAIVLDEYGGTAGLVTIEDLIEEIVGEIQDEYDVEEPMIVALSENEARVDGRASVDDLGEHFKIELNGADSEHYDTVGGLVYHEMAGVPAVGDTVQVDGLTLTVETTDGRRVGKVLVVRQPVPESAEDDEADDE
ncbi:MAG TPA: hemolysin family protein [Candidatus Limnocylindrales bacterium]|nr:hemolysin family protein [Candidatus Limnocylindrales bacterium]